ncbi:MAG: hypothetical protein FWF72_02390 [Paludibacter sp.]|nr:hypothetical protein [Paludibacter sp.]
MTDFIQIFSQPIGKPIILQIISEIERQPSDFQKLFDLIFYENKNIGWRAAWVADHLSRKHADWFSNRMKIQLMRFAQISIPSGHLRLCLSILLNAGLPDEISGDFINFCFENILNEKTAIAVKAQSVKILSEICKTEPDLRNEVEAVLQNIDIQNYTAGMKTVVKKFLNKKPIKILPE